MKTKVLNYKTVIKKDGKYYHGFVPALLGCHTFGKTIEETRKNLTEAIEGYLFSCVKNKDPIPQDMGFESIQTFSIPVLQPRPKKSYA